MLCDLYDPVLRDPCELGPSNPPASRACTSRTISRRIQQSRPCNAYLAIQASQPENPGLAMRESILQSKDPHRATLGEPAASTRSERVQTRSSSHSHPTESSRQRYLDLLIVYSVEVLYRTVPPREAGLVTTCPGVARPFLARPSLAQPRLIIPQRSVPSIRHRHVRYASPQIITCSAHTFPPRDARFSHGAVFPSPSYYISHGKVGSSQTLHAYRHCWSYYKAMARSEQGEDDHLSRPSRTPRAIWPLPQSS